jgi:hypothetical protein
MENDNKTIAAFAPKISNDSISKFEILLDKLKQLIEKINKKIVIIIGIIRFSYNNENFIHCPIKKIKNNGGTIKIGRCKHFNSLLDTVENRKKLTYHKFIFHCKGEKSNKNNNMKFKLNTTKTFDEVLINELIKYNKKLKNK